MRRLLPVLIAASALAAAGCGSAEQARQQIAGNLDAASSAAVSRAASRTADAGSAAIDVRATLTVAGRQIPISGSGAFDLAHKRGRMDMSMTVPGSGAMTTHELLDGTDVYLSGDALARLLPSGRTWVKLDLNKAAAKAGIDLGSLQQATGGTDPTQFLSYLAKAGSVRKAGTETVNGTPTTRYHATIDLQRLGSSSGDPKLAASLRSLQKATGLRTMPTDVWIDASGRVRRQTVDYSVAGAAPVRMAMTIDYSRFGVPVDVTAPPASEIAELGDLTGP